VAEFERAKLTASMPPVLIAKWSPPVLDEGYVAFPKRLIRAAPRLFTGPTALEQLAVVLTLVDYLRPNIVRFPSIGFLAFTAGVEPERFKERLDELVAAGLIKTFGGRDALRYELDGLYSAIIEASDEA
jgi:hypothetical protein